MTADPAALAAALREAASIEANDDTSLLGTDERLRHVKLVGAMLRAAEFLEALGPPSLSRAEDAPYA